MAVEAPTNSELLSVLEEAAMLPSLQGSLFVMPLGYWYHLLCKGPFSPPIHVLIIFSAAGVKSSLPRCLISFYERYNKGQLLLPVSPEGMFFITTSFQKKKKKSQKVSQLNANKVAENICMSF
jgi:hypothetical protein